MKRTTGVDKKQIGLFLKQLREEKGYSKSQLANLLYLNDDSGTKDITPTAIRKWENGETNPSLDNLLSLCKIYKLTLDEIINHEKISVCVFEKKYPDVTKGDGKTDSFLKQRLLIETNAKRLIARYLQNKTTFSDEQELAFLLKRYGAPKYKTLSSLKDLNKRLLESVDELSDAKKSSELTKIIYLFCFDQHIDYFNFFFSLMDGGIFDEEKYKLFQTLSNEMKNTFLSFFQSYNAVFLRNDLDVESTTKETIKKMIQGGAKIDKRDMGRIVVSKKKYKTIKLAELIYQLAYQPLTFDFDEMDFAPYKTRYVAKNTPTNRFYFDYWYPSGLGSIDKCTVEKIVSSDIPSVNHFIDIAKQYMVIHTDTTVKDVFEQFGYELLTIWYRYLQDETFIKTLIDTKDNIFKAIKLGRTEYEVTCIVKRNYPFETFFEERLEDHLIGDGGSVEETKKLMEEIDNLSLNEIREKYFPWETRYEE